jgi:hypothetical protein
MNLHTLSLLLGSSSAAMAGIKNKEWPLWAAPLVLKANSAGNVNDAAFVGAYPVGCFRSDGFVGLPQNVDPATAIVITSTANRTFYGNTAAHTGEVTTNSRPTKDTLGWTCCKQVDSANCPGRVAAAGTVDDGTMWALHLKNNGNG